MVREQFSRQYIRKAVEEFGSELHLAKALATTREQLQAWLSGIEEPPLEIYQAIADVIEARKKPRG